MENPWKTLQITEKYNNPWIRITHQEVLNPAGNPGIYGVVHFKNIAIGIVPLDEDNNTWLVGQYRYPLKAYSWEIPEGGCPVGSDPLESAQRELQEETGIIAQNWTKIADLHLSNCVTDEEGIAYIAQGLSFGKATPEETEELQVKKVPFDTAYQMVLDGRITDSLSMIALMRAKIWLDHQSK